MAFIPVPNTAQMELVYLWDGQIVQNVLHYTQTGSPTAGNMTALAQALISWFDTDMKLKMSEDISLVEVRGIDLEDQFEAAIVEGTGLPIAGTVTGQCLPNNVTVAITKRTAFRGRSFRGRIYHPGIPVSRVNLANPNQVTASGLAGFLSAYEAIRTLTVDTVEWLMTVVSRQFEGQPRVTGVATAVSNFTSDGVLDSQRRRLPGRGQ